MPLPLSAFPGGSAQAANVAALTDNGGGTADGTVASMAAPTTLTDGTGLSGTHDDILADPSIPDDITGTESPTEAEFNLLLGAVRKMSQNDSDIAQKIIEIVTLLTTIQNNMKEVTTTFGNEIAALKAAGLQASA
jgi:hypothetical protein